MKTPDLTKILKASNLSNTESQNLLFNSIFSELKKIAAKQMSRENSNHTLQPTALVNEAYFKLIDQSLVDWKNRSHFFAVASKIMRRILVDHARAKYADKRGGRMPKEELQEELIGSVDIQFELTSLDEALKELEELEPRHSRVVELKFFGGLDIEEIAEVLDTSKATVKRDWQFARAWLYKKLKD
jgi:RNA polymerase sigma-70 factor, ECF subfamily